MRNDPRDPESWFDYAEQDLQRAVRRVAEEDITDAFFHMQQSAEKALKGKLIALGWNLIRTHNLAALSKELLIKGIDLSWFEGSADLLTAQYLTDRYPHITEPLPEKAAIDKALAETKRLFEELTGRQFTA